ncbi:winged helix-turn-helix transcriptional regulator [Mycolicibacterium sp.]|uniref:winged helix-turn-helix transcriptional regulator n=1 Tax=Mycolicibacterium sp. TaxID=2320850 RepID=UPI001A24A1EF|nr:winged helix-turn-helix transcriptional regulator [Mycolicibacterium sp.]MBJ7338713.1 helix-turn-helix transcriptional regulator [Mycolicibacterium sp.]
MLGVLGDEWTLLILQQSLLGITRYREFAARLPISNAVLTGRLAAMTADGLLSRTLYQDNPPRHEYVLTPRGRALWPVLTSIWEWERRWVPEHAERLPTMHHAVCDADFAPLITCRACTQVVSEKELTVAWGPSGSWQRSMPIESTRRRSGSGTAVGRAGLFPETMSILGNRWSFALLVSAFVGASRFNDFTEQLGAPPSSLAHRLQIFTAGDVLEASGGGYLLTEKGRAVFGILITALQWAQRSFESPEGPAVLLRHTLCGNAFDAVLTCDQCAGTLRGADVERRDAPFRWPARTEASP